MTVTANIDARLLERERITNELHDRCIKNISSVALRLEAMVQKSKDFDDLSPDATETVLECITELRDVDRVVRQVLANTLELPARTTLRHELARLVLEHNKRSSVRANLRPIADVDFLPESLEQIVMIVSEALENAHRHSGGTDVWIDTREIGLSPLVIEISDNGTGLPFVNTERFGLRTMRSRARELGGILVTKNGRFTGGAQIVLHVPLAGNAL